MQSKRRLKHWLPLTVSLALFAVVILGGFLGSQTSWARRDVAVVLAPALVNADFEGGFHEHAGIGELTVADGWSPWYSEQGGRHRPEYKAEVVGAGKGRVFEGQQSQKLFTTYSSHLGGIYQQFEVEPGKWYKCTAMVYIWSSSENDPDKSVKPGRYRAMIGIHPWGGTSGEDDTVIWGQEIVDTYDEWREVSVSFQPWHSPVTLLLKGNPWYGCRHNDSYWDDVDCQEIIVGGPTPTPYPTPEAGAVDYQRIEEIVLTVVAGREPAHWPR